MVMLPKLITSYGCIIVFHALVPKVTTFRNSNMKDILVENQRTHRTENLVVERALDDDVLNNVENGRVYTSAFEHGMDTVELPALIVDYANLIRNDIILLDNSVETRTRKRGNFIYNQAISDASCGCESSSFQQKMKDLGEDAFPRFVESKVCNSSKCDTPYECQKSLYNITVLKRRNVHENIQEDRSIEIPQEFRHRWIAYKYEVTVGCICAREYVKAVDEM